LQELSSFGSRFQDVFVMGIQPGWVFHMVKQSQIIPTLKKSNVSKTIFRDSMRLPNGDWNDPEELF